MVNILLSEEDCQALQKEPFRNSCGYKGHQSRITGSKVTAILVKGYILFIGGVALGRVCVCSRLVNNDNHLDTVSVS